MKDEAMISSSKLGSNLLWAIRCSRKEDFHVRVQQLTTKLKEIENFNFVEKGQRGKKNHTSRKNVWYEVR